MLELNGEEKQVLKRFLDKVSIKEIMIKDVVTVYEDDDLSEAQQKFVEHNVNYLIVVDHDRKLVGLLSRKYIYKTLAPRKIISEEMDYDPHIIIDGDSFYEKESLDSYILRNIMSKKPFALKPEDTLRKALQAMADKKISCIPIVDVQSRPCGVLSHQELVTFIADLLGSV